MKTLAELLSEKFKKKNVFFVCPPHQEKKGGWHKFKLIKQTLFKNNQVKKTKKNLYKIKKKQSYEQ